MVSISWRARALKTALREAIQQSGLSARQVAIRMGIGRMHITRWLAPTEPPPSIEKITALLEVLGTPPQEQKRILAIAQPTEADWVLGDAHGVNPGLAAVLELERYATRITEWQPLVWPGLLQSRMYARAMFTDSGGFNPISVETKVMVRLARRDVLARRPPVQFTGLVGVPAIQGMIGGPEVAVDQLTHVADVTQRPNVTVQAVDLAGKWNPGHAGAFMLFEFETLPPAVLIEHHRGALVVTEEDDVAAYKTAAETIRRAAMSPDDTRGLIAETIATRSMEMTK